MPNAVVVIGGGIAGLATTFELLQRARSLSTAPEIVCIDAVLSPGGNIRTEHEAGFVCEWGPNGFLDNAPATLELIRRVDITDRLLPSDRGAAKRFLFRDGTLRRIPHGPLSFATSSILSWRGKLDVLAEPFRPAKRDDVEESIHDFATRRIGGEAARTLVAAMVTGVHAGDAMELSLQATFPQLARMERDHGGLVRGMLRLRIGGSSGGGSTALTPGRLTSFRDGLDELPKALARALGSTLRSGIAVTKIADMGVRGFRVFLAEGAPLDAGAVVLACPAHTAARIVASMDGALASAMVAIPSAPLAVVHTGYATSDLPAPLDGFGYLVPRGEVVRSLGTVWSSSIFPGHRAPDGHVLLTTMLGGATDREVLSLSDAALLATVGRGLSTTMGVTHEPRFTKIIRHPRGIPQYTLGHVARLATIERRLAAHGGLLVCGNSYRGVSINACIAEAPGIADAALASMRRD